MVDGRVVELAVDEDSNRDQTHLVLWTEFQQAKRAQFALMARLPELSERGCDQRHDGAQDDEQQPRRV